MMIRLSAILWFAALIALIVAGSPAAVEAHPGHGPAYGHGVHSSHQHFGGPVRLSTPAPDRHSANASPPAVEVGAGVVPGSALPPAGSDCGDCSCMIGHCATCVAAIAARVDDLGCPGHGSDFGRHRAFAVAGALPVLLKRPPKS